MARNLKLLVYVCYYVQSGLMHVSIYSCSPVAVGVCLHFFLNMAHCVYHIIVSLDDICPVSATSLSAVLKGHHTLACCLQSIFMQLFNICLCNFLFPAIFFKMDKDM